MNKAAIQRFAIQARKDLIEQVSQRAYQYGITKDGYGEINAVTVGGRALSSDEQKQRKELVEQIRRKGYMQVMEEVAYTWFNRFIALRFMEVNNYLPSHIRVFSDSTGAFKPEILNDVLHLDLPGLDADKVAEYIESNQTEALYRYLLLTQCNALNASLPRMFEQMGGYTELLFPNNILKADSVLGRMVTDIPEEDWTDQVQIIGWLYQYYISEKHENVINVLGKSSIKKEDIPAATQLFTTDWVVRYMVDNSLGRYWIERHPESKLREKLDFFVLPKSGEIAYIDDPVKPQDLTFFDPCMGSGHILVYAFDVLMEIYKEYGYGERDATAEIIKYNLYGLDIDERCSQLAYFAVMMKARSYDRRLLTRGIKPHVLSISESNGLDKFTHPKFMPDTHMNKIGEYLIETFRNAKEIGSLQKVVCDDYDAFVHYIDKCEKESALDLELSFWENTEKPLIEQLAEQAKILSQKYTIVCTNPPYMNKLEGHLKDFVVKNYKPFSGDLFSVFMYRNFGLCKANGYSAFMTPNVWMFLKTYEKLREYLRENKSISSMVQMAKGAFFKEATVDVCSFVLGCKPERTSGIYIRLDNFKGDMEVQKDYIRKAISNPTNCDYLYEAKQASFTKIPGAPIAYWLSDHFVSMFTSGKMLGSIADSKQGLATADNDRFVRAWFEVCIGKINFYAKSTIDASNSGFKWFPYNKGGEFRKWYGNNNYIVNWENDGYEIRHFFDKNGKLRSRPQNTNYYFRESVSWSDITSGINAFRYKPYGHIFDITGMSFFPGKDLLYLLSLCNTKVVVEVLKIVAPTIHCQCGDVANIPVIIDTENKELIEGKTRENIQLSRSDWDSYETSWDFQHHPLIRSVSRLSDAYAAWKSECEKRFLQLKANEEGLNRIFIDIYGLQDELTPEVADKDVTVHRIFDTKDDVPESMQGSNYVRTKRDEVVSLISYAVGCMFGRYSLDVEGLAYAGGDWDDVYRKDRLVDEHGNAITFGGISIGVSKEYTYINVGGEWKELTFPVDADNIIPICDDDYFEDDMTGRFVKWVEAVYGSDMLEENLKFIADALGGKGTPREVIRSYFLNDFYADHCKTYQKRPIYWLFDSGKKNGFKALIYMHRYQSDLLARMRTDYVHEQQERYRTQLTHLADAIDHASASERVKLTKQQKKIQEQSLEIQKYEEKVHHLADQNIQIDLDDGVKHNYELFADVLAKIK